MLRSLLSAVIALATTSVQAQSSLYIDSTAERMRVDGALSEWKGAHFAELGVGEAGSVRYALAEADEGLYVGAEVRDDVLVTGPKGDALILSFAMPVPDSSKWQNSELSLFPGETGKTKAEAKLSVGGRARNEPALQIVEGPRKRGDGYVIEAYVPWKAISGAQIWEQGRGALRFVDADGQGAPTNVATASGTGNALPQLAVGSHQRDLLGTFMRERKLDGVTPRYDFRSNVSGDVQPERVAIVDRYVVVYGPGYKGGDAYNYFALPYANGGGLEQASLVDLTGDARNELVVVVRQQNAIGTRKAWLVLSLNEEGMQQVFGAELRKEAQGGFVEDTVALLPPKASVRVPRIELTVGRAQGLDASSYHEQPASDITPILLPWGDIVSQRYAFDGSRFALLDETKRKVGQTAAPVAPPSVSAPNPAPSEPAPAGPEDALALFKSQQKLPANAKPTRTLLANVMPGSAKERVDQFGNVFVLTGSDIAQGRGFIAYSVPVADVRELLDVRAADVTADGNDELLVRVHQALTGSDGIERELLMVLRPDEQDRLQRLLLAEVARRQGASAIENKLITQAGALVIEPGTARGWNGGSYPFKPDAVGGAERLLLPWSDRAVRYHRDGARLVPVP